MTRSAVVALPEARDGLSVLGQEIKKNRISKQWTVADLAARAGVSPRTVRLAETGDSAISAGNLFNIAVLAGVSLFGSDTPAALAQLRKRGEETLALMPVRVRTPDLGDPSDYFN